MPKTDYSQALEALKADVAALPRADVSAGDAAGLEGAVQQMEQTLLAQLAAMDSAVQSAAGSSSAAAGLSQSASAAAREAVDILQRLEAELRIKGAQSVQAPLLAGRLREKLGFVASAATVMPSQLADPNLAEQLKALVGKTEGVASERGYRFDALHEMSEAQTSNVKTMGNRLEELKQVLDVQRVILERHLQQPVTKTWFARPFEPAE